MKIWITKYALTKGIIEADGMDVHSASTMTVVRRNDHWGNHDTYYHANEWYRTREDAVQQAELMRKKKIASLQKQIKTLEAITFE